MKAMEELTGFSGINEATEAADAEAIEAIPDGNSGGGQAATLLDGSGRLEQLADRMIEMGTRIDELGKRVEQRDRVAALIGELRELPRLFSGADVLSIDEEGWRSIEEGGSVLGAYVRSEHRRRLAAEANKAGALASSGEVSGGVGAVYSVDEIRSMDRSTVRKNLDKVLSSLEAVGG